jgi:predicted Zn-dependent protease
MKSLRMLSLALLLAAPVALADGLPDLGEAASADLSPAMERRLGESTMTEIRLRDPTYLDDAEVESYVNRLGARLAAQAGAVENPFRFFVLRDPTINAFATFGGYIGVNTGLLLAAQSESEVASVLAHEISHVTQRHLARQVAQQRQMGVASVIGMALAILAARSNAQVATAALATTEAASIQSQLSFSRDFEREADRLGFETLSKAGFDPQGMVVFFERLQRSGRVYENNAPVYLRTHPLTVERITDMGHRASELKVRQVPDSPEFALVRAKLRAQQGQPADAVKEMQTLLQEGKFTSAPAARYGVAVALQRTGQYAAAEKQLALIPKAFATNPMVVRLGAELRAQQGDWTAARSTLQAATKRNPDLPALWYAYSESLLALNQADEARRFLEEQVRMYSSDGRLYTLLARSYGQLGRLGAQHRALAEGYVLNGQLPMAIEQLQIAQRAAGNDFIEQSVIEARLRELKARQLEEARQKKN